jgi:uncharacterized protein YjbI with pentapeptide repeats
MSKIKMGELEDPFALLAELVTSLFMLHHKENQNTFRINTSPLSYHAAFERAIFGHVSFEQATFNHVSFEQATFNHVSFEHATFSNNVFDDHVSNEHVTFDHACFI